MTAAAVAVLALFALSVVGVAIVVLADRSDDTGGEDDEHERDAAWLEELRALNDALPRMRKHRARQRKAGAR